MPDNEVIQATEEDLLAGEETLKALDALMRKRKWLDNRESDRGFCMRACTTGRENPFTGCTFYKHIPCGDPLCPKCGPVLREEFQKALEPHLEDGLRRIVVDSPEARAKLVRKYGGKANLSCFPFEENDTIKFELLIKTNDNIGEKLERITLSDLLRWSDKVFDHAKSGTLHKLSPTPPKNENLPERDEPMAEVEKQEIILDLSNCRDEKGEQHTEQYWYWVFEKETVEATQDLLPTTLKELEQVLPIWRLERQRVIQKYGGVILRVYTGRITVRESQLDWKRRLKILTEG